MWPAVESTLSHPCTQGWIPANTHDHARILTFSACLQDWKRQHVTNRRHRMNSGHEDEAAGADSGIHAGHIKPRFWIAPGVFEKELNSKDFVATGPQAAADARQSGWTPRATAMGDATDHLDPDTHTHNALQHLGIGAGHEAYYSMMETFAGVIMSNYNRKSLVTGRRLNERLDAKTISGASFRDIASFAMLVSPFPSAGSALPEARR